MRPAQICERNRTCVRFLLYNTFCEVAVLDRPEAGQALDAVIAEAEAVQQLLDAYDPESELSRLNVQASSGLRTPISENLFALLLTLLRSGEASGGRFDITVGSLLRLWNFTAGEPRKPRKTDITGATRGYRHVSLDGVSRTAQFLRDGLSLDCGAAGKGYAAGRIASRLQAMGVGRATINLGGNLHLLGSGPHAGKWRVGVQQPWARRGETAGILMLDGDVSVSTSGGYDRYFTQGGQVWHHLLDPATGEPARSNRTSCTVVSRDALAADVLSTVLFVGGPDCFIRTASSVWPKADAGYVLANGTEIELSENVKGRFEAMNLPLLGDFNWC